MFDRYVAVDWSANSVPKLGRDSIWIAVYERGETSLVNLATRTEAEDFLADLFDRDASPRTLLGVDFSLGYPAGTARALGLADTPWSAMWALLAERVRDDARNRNNRFSVAADLNLRITGVAAPFWGCPPSAASVTLRPTMPTDSETVTSWRAVEDVLRSRGRRPFSSWQLLGAGAVGSQSLLGIPMLARLCDRFSDRVDVWPFTTGLRAPDAFAGSVVVVEVWPSMLAIESAPGTVRDAAQVEATVRWMVDVDAALQLGALFTPDLPSDVASRVVREEGWVLGVTA